MVSKILSCHASLLYRVLLPRESGRTTDNTRTKTCLWVTFSNNIDCLDLEFLVLTWADALRQDSGKLQRAASRYTT